MGLFLEQPKAFVYIIQHSLEDFSGLASVIHPIGVFICSSLSGKAVENLPSGYVKV